MLKFFLLIGFLHSCYTQETEESSEDDGSDYNYEFDASYEVLNATLEPTTNLYYTTLAESDTSTATESTTYETQTDDGFGTVYTEEPLDVLPENSTNRPVEDWETWSEEQLVNRIKYEWLANPYMQRTTDYQFKILCYLISHTFRSANKDLKRYYKIRTLYENNVEYEIGYVSQEIIHRYSHVLELFHQVQKLYDDRPTTMFAPIKYVFNMYATVLEECKHIIHLCHMINVIEKKYIAKTPDSIFKEPVTESVTDSTKKKEKTKHTNDKDKIIEEQRRKRLEELLKNRKIQKKKRKNYIALWQQSTPKKATSKKHPWPLLYGWSIEDW